MVAVSRRSALSGIGAIAGLGVTGGSLVTAAWPSRVEAAAQVGKQVPGVYRYKVGTFEVTAITDGALLFKLDSSLVRNASLEEVKSALAEAFLPTDLVPIPVTTLVVNTGTKLVVIDTGFANNGPPTTGQMAAGLAVAGIDPAAVTTVLISHFHFDHIAGLRSKEGALTFPNAEIMVPEAEWAYWMDEANASRAPDPLKGSFANAKRVFEPVAKDVVRFSYGKELVPGISAVDARGHTPGHSAFAVSSGDSSLMVLSDVTNVPFLFVRHPDWQVMFDMDGETARATRHRLLDMVSAERMQVSGYHFPFPATGFIARDGAGYQLVPQMWQSTL